MVPLECDTVAVIRRLPGPFPRPSGSLDPPHFSGGGVGGDKAKGKATALPGMLGGTAFEGNVGVKRMETVGKKRTGSETRCSAGFRYRRSR